MKILSKLNNTGMIEETANKRYVTDAEKLKWNNKSDTDTVTTINGKTGAISKEDIVALGIPSRDTNTTYSEITTAEIDAGTASAGRTISGRRVKYILDKVSSMISVAIGTLTKSSVGLGNVDNTSDASKPISTATQAALDGKVNNSRVLTNVPSGAKFTDTITTINGKTGAITKDDIVALGIPSHNTTYSEITTDEIDAGNGVTVRSITARRLKYLSDKIIALFPTKTSDLTNDSGFLTRWPTWSEVTGKPSTFAPSSHSHTGTTTTGTYTTHTTAYGTISLGPANSSYNHINSSLAKPFYMYQDLLVAGGKQVWHTGNSAVTGDVSLLNGWTNYNAIWGTPRATKTLDKMVVVTGFIKGGSLTSGANIARLPSGMWPSHSMTFLVATGGSPSKVTINANGYIIHEGSGTNNTWFSLSGITFFTG